MNDTPNTTSERNQTCRSSRTKNFLIAGAIIGALGAGATAFAADGLPSKKGDCKYSSSPAELREKADRKANRFARYVGLSDAQRTQLEPIIDDAVDDYIEHRTEGRALRREAKALMMAGSVDPNAYEPLREDAMEWFDEASSIAMQHALQAASILTDEQRQDLAHRAAKRWKSSQ